MTKLRAISGGCAALALSLAAATAHAADPVALPPAKQAGDVAWVSGGIGDDEARRFQAGFDQYPLVVRLFSAIGGRNEYTSDAVVKVVDAQGAVRFEQKADGPFLLLRLPAGDYSVAATLNGSTLPTQKVKVPARGHVEATFVFRSDAK